MKGIGGNITGYVQRLVITINEIGEQEKTWMPIQSIKGWLDLVSGSTSFTSFNAKIQESTHVFVADYVSLNPAIDAESCRMVVAGKVYDITLIDDPMGMHEQLEIYLKFSGGAY